MSDSLQLKQLEEGYDHIALAKKLREMIDFSNHLMERIDMYAHHYHQLPPYDGSTETSKPVFPENEQPL